MLPAAFHSRPFPTWRKRIFNRARPFAPDSLPVYRLLAIQVAIIFAMMTAASFEFEGRDISIVATCLAGGIALAAVMRWRGTTRIAIAIAIAIEGMTLVLASSMTVACLSILLATLAPPYVDHWLAAADAHLFPFLSWPDLAIALRGQPALTSIMCQIYSSLLWQPFALIGLLALVGQADAIWRFLHIWILALSVCVTIFAVAPAVTAYVHYGFALSDFPALTVNAGWRPAEIIAQVRSGAIEDLNVSNMSGLITFPSFHSAAAVILAWSFQRIPLIRTPFILLNGLMILTVPMIGSHYFIDVCGGIALAVLAIYATRPRSSRAPSHSGAPTNPPSTPGFD
ncbi:MAG: phosphatase PAP2 family protein [Candidatus Sphingomonas phytovorans]|nr:phosphatase PAP2 family protein [Sphingomonas sp.]WEK00993.1 MAG: phosphatase PAP2 family protein [Sphingomonas sp.]